MAIIDANENGMSDIWERKYQVVDIDPAADPDNDRQTNLQECHAGTDPEDKYSVLSLYAIKHHQSALLVSWNSKIGQKYQIQHSSNLLDRSWVNDGGAVMGQGGLMTVAYASPSDEHRFFRVRVVNDHSDLIRESLETIDHDTDGDGQRDLLELDVGCDPFDRQSHWQSPVIAIGEAVNMSWLSEKGKRYQLQSRSLNPQGVWVDQGAPYLGTGGEVNATVVRSNTLTHEYRLNVYDVDTDEDGLADWEEEQVNLDPLKTRTNTLSDGDWQVLQERLLANNVVEVKAKRAVANITRKEDGGFELIRSSGLDELTVIYTVSGTAVADADYETLSGSVTLPFGQESVVIPVTPLAGSTMELSESVILNLQDTSTYDLGPLDAQQVNVIKEVAMNVKDYGAVGDGVTDDTLAVQAALDALEASSSHNTLYFPAGRYCLNQVVPDDLASRSRWRILLFGSSDLAGRDMIFTGDEGSVLYSTVSPVRAHMLVILATFRSLSSRGLTWEKDSSLLSEMPAGHEPNGADGVSLVATDLRIVEHVDFEQCKFINCHGAVMLTANGYDRRGHLRQLKFHDCELLNPYGSNTMNSGAAWGGGQQTYLSQWVGDAIYKGNLFEGGGEDMTDASTSPGGKLKDAAVIGGPMRLIFTDNTVRRMGVEAVFHHGRQRWMNQNDVVVTIPPADGVTETSFKVRDHPTTFVAGQLILVHTQVSSSGGGKDNIFRVTAYDSETRVLSVVNEGHEVNAEPGTTIEKYADIYLEGSAPRLLSIIQNNLIEGYFPPGSTAISYSVGVTMNTRALIKDNVIKGYLIGIMSYKEVTPYPWSKGMQIDSNVILTRDTSVEYPFGTMGVRSWASDQLIVNNIVWTPVSQKVAGIVVYGNGALIKNNHVIAQKIIRHDYTSSLRSIGVGMHNTAINTVFEGNHTYGMDVGVGPSAPSQSIPHRVISHYSHNDALPVDPRGLVE